MKARGWTHANEYDYHNSRSKSQRDISRRSSIAFTGALEQVGKDTLSAPLRFLTTFDV